MSLVLVAAAGLHFSLISSLQHECAPRLPTMLFLLIPSWTTANGSCQWNLAFFASPRCLSKCLHRACRGCLGVSRDRIRSRANAMAAEDLAVCTEPLWSCRKRLPQPMPPPKSRPAPPGGLRSSAVHQPPVVAQEPLLIRRPGLAGAGMPRMTGCRQSKCRMAGHHSHSSGLLWSGMSVHLQR